jgi:hypothetical protein
VLVQEPEKIDDCWQRGRFSTLIPRERVVAAAGKTRRDNLTQAELATDASDLFALPLAIAQHEFISRRRITSRAASIKLYFATGSAAPARQPFHPRDDTGMIDGEGLTVEASHALAGFAVQTFPRHGHFSLNWITSAASRKVILM